jgi:hypothetical protein
MQAANAGMLKALAEKMNLVSTKQLNEQKKINMGLRNKILSHE